MPSPSATPSSLGVHRVDVRPIQVAEKRSPSPSAPSSSHDERSSTPAALSASSPSSSPLFSASTSAAAAPVLVVSDRPNSGLPALHSSSSASSASSTSSLLSAHSAVAFHRSSSRCSTSSVPGPSPPPRRTAPDPPTASLSVRCGHFSMQGLRAEMEDKVVLLPHPLFNSTAELLDCVPRSYFAVFDGHGGDVSAEYCIAAGTLVHLADGTSVPIEEVQVGARVLSYSAAEEGKTEGLVGRKVAARMDNGLKECVELLFSDGRVLVCTPDHRIRTAAGRWSTARDLEVGADDAAVEYPKRSAVDTAEDDDENADDRRYRSHDKITHGVHRDATVLPLFRLQLVGRRDVGLKHVYDLSVPSEQGDDTASFTANGVIVHNCKQHVHLNLLAEPAFPQAPSKALHSALLRTDNDFCAACRRINLMSSSGTTALCAFLQRHTLTVANIGDSRAVLVKRSGAVQPLSSDHKPGRKDEKARIEALGGRVATSEEDAWAERGSGGGSSGQPSCAFLASCFPSTRPLRVFPGGLSVSRTIGDIGCKGMRLVIAEAEVWEADLRASEDQWVVMGCDGVWDVLSNQTVADLCRKWDDKQQQRAEQSSGAARPGKHPFDELAECIAKEAFKRGSSDNISVAVIRLDWQDAAPA